MVASGAPSSFETVEQIAAHLGYAPKLAYTIHSALWLETDMDERISVTPVSLKH